MLHQKCQVVSLTEHWLNNTDLVQLILPYYKWAFFYSRLTRLHGGVAIFMQNDVNYKKKELSVEMVCEVAAIEQS